MKKIKLPLTGQSPTQNYTKKGKLITKDIKLLQTNYNSIYSNMVSKKMSPPLIKTWLNGVYNFNQSLIKNLPSADNMVYKLIKSYFFMNPLWQNLDLKKSRLLVRRFRRASLNRIELSKPEIKHGSDKVFINLYIFNKRKNTYLYKLNHIYKNMKLGINNGNYIPLLSVQKASPFTKNNENKFQQASQILRKFIGIALSQKNSLEIRQNNEIIHSLLPSSNSNYFTTDFSFKSNNESMRNFEERGGNNNQKLIADTYTSFSHTQHTHANMILPFEASQIANVSNKSYNTLHNYIIRTKKGVSHTLDVLSYGVSKSHVSALKHKTKSFLTPMSDKTMKYDDNSKKFYNYLPVKLNGFVTYKPVVITNKTITGTENTPITRHTSSINGKGGPKINFISGSLGKLHAFYKGGINLRRFLLSERNKRSALTITKVKNYNTPEVLKVQKGFNIENKILGPLASKYLNVKNSNNNIKDLYAAKTMLHLNAYEKLELYNKYKNVVKQTLREIFKYTNQNSGLSQMQSNFMCFTSGLNNKNVIFNLLNKYKLLGGEKLTSLTLYSNNIKIEDNSNILDNMGSRTIKKHTSVFKLKYLSILFKDLSMTGFNNRVLVVSKGQGAKPVKVEAYKNTDKIENMALTLGSVHKNNLFIKPQNLLNESYLAKLNLVKTLIFKFNIITNSSLHINRKATLEASLKSLNMVITPKIIRNLAPILPKGIKSANKVGFAAKSNMLKARYMFIKNIISMGVPLPQAYSPIRSVTGVVKPSHNILAPLYGTKVSTDSITLHTKKNILERKVDKSLWGPVGFNNDNLLKHMNLRGEEWKQPLHSVKVLDSLNATTDSITREQISKFYNTKFRDNTFKVQKHNNKPVKDLNFINEYTYMSNAFNKLDKFFYKYKDNLVVQNDIRKSIYLTYKKKIINQILSLETTYIHYLTLVEFNNSLFKNWFINPLCNIISRIYNKKVIFNIVSLKAMYLNSDILSSLISIRLNNHKKNRYNKVFKKVLRTVALAKVNEHSYNSQSEIYSSLNNHYEKYLTLNHAIGLKPLNSNYLTETNKSLNGEKGKNHSGTVIKKLNPSLVNTINFIKHKSVFGIRLEASGRLTKRSTASRKIFKFRYLGNLRLNDTINRKIPGVMVKDKITNNLQFSKISSKTRNGAFGIKGWINQA